MSHGSLPRDILDRRLFHVQGELVDLYNQALHALTGKRTALTSFSIDKRGYSPEVAQELAPDYLQSSPSHRYVIILSPDQRASDMIRGDFSFDREILDRTFETFMPSISVGTRMDGLYGELDDSVRAYYSPEDLLMLSSVRVTFKSTSGFLEKAMHLQNLIASLKADPELLIDQNSRVVDEVYTLAREVGDIRGISALAPIDFELPITKFYTGLYQGAYVFKKDPNDPEPAPGTLKRDSLPGYGLSDFKQNRAVVVYGDAGMGTPPESDRNVLFIPLSDTENVMAFLLRNRLVSFDGSLIDRRLTAIEDSELLKQGFKVFEMTAEQRTRELTDLMDRMPEEWHALIDVKRKHARGISLDRIKCPPSIQAMIVRPLENTSRSAIVFSLMTRLVPLDLGWLFRYHPDELENTYAESDDLIKEYILTQLRQHRSKGL